jgi:hypothetical protein
MAFLVWEHNSAAKHCPCMRRTFKRANVRQAQGSPPMHFAVSLTVVSTLIALLIAWFAAGI